MQENTDYTTTMIKRKTMATIKQGAIARNIKYHEYLEQVIKLGLKAAPATTKIQ